MRKSTSCVNCRSSNTVKHGRTQKGRQRYRCIDCGKTWTQDKAKQLKADMSKLTKYYLDGKSTRELVKFYQTSPVRINQLIRSFLLTCPHWEAFVDSFIPKHSPKQIYLSGKKFYCSWAESPNNEMYVAFAIDSLSGFVIGYEISGAESSEPWIRLLERLNERKAITSSFLTNGSESSLKAVKQVFPNADIRINYHKNYRDKELSCCLSRITPNQKLIADAAKIYFSNENKHLAALFGISDEKSFQEFLNRHQENFMNIVRGRLQLRMNLNNDSLPLLFQQRFEKFHLLKEDPKPIINGWIARQMLVKSSGAFSRLALYTQLPYALDFKEFSENKKPILSELPTASPQMITMIIEIAARCLELPVITNECNFSFERCMLI